jgi:hypothetical protein
MEIQKTECCGAVMYQDWCPCCDRPAKPAKTIEQQDRMIKIAINKIGQRTNIDGSLSEEFIDVLRDAKEEVIYE